MDRSRVAAAAKSISLLAVAAATTDRPVQGLCLFLIVRLAERHWENQP